MENGILILTLKTKLKEYKLHGFSTHITQDGVMDCDFITVHIIIFICGTLLMHNNLEIITPVFFLNLKKNQPINFILSSIYMFT